MKNFNWSKYNTDKFSGHGYQNIYNNYISRKSKIVVELGSRFESAQVWKDYFIDAKIICADIVKFNPPEGIEFVAFDMNNTKNYNKLPNNIDIVIEDGPHTSKSQLTCLEQIIPKLSKNGIILFEDLHCTEKKYKNDLIKYQGDSDITINDLLREWKHGKFKDYKYIKGSKFKDTKFKIFIEHGNNIRWPHMNTPSEVIVFKKL